MSDHRSPARVVAVGDSSVGKTSIIAVAMEQPFNSFEQNTVGANWNLYNATVRGSPFEMQIWDTAGQERYRTLGPLYYRQATAAICVFDVTSHESFTNLSRWIDSFTAVAGTSSLIFIVGNKTDITDERQVTGDEAIEWVKDPDRNYPYFETSAKSGEGVKALFEAVAEAVAGMPRRPASEQLIPGGGSRCC